MRVFVLTLLTLPTIAVAACCLEGCAPSAAAPAISTANGAPATAAASAVWLNDYQQALTRATAEKKPILADFTGSDWCGTCIALKREVFSTPAFVAWASEHVVLLEVDFPNDTPLPAALKQQNEQLATTFVVDQFPTILFIDASGKKLGQTGYVAGGPQPWIASAEAIIGH